MSGEVRTRILIALGVVGVFFLMVQCVRISSVPTSDEMARIDARNRAAWTDGHEAGRDWALANGISNPEDCGGNSSQFREGCYQEAEEQAAQERYDASARLTE